MLNAVSATSAISRRPILVAFYDTHGDTDDTFSTLTPGPHGGRAIYIDIAFITNLVDSRTAREDKRSIPYVRENIPTRPRLTPRAKREVPKAKSNMSFDLSRNNSIAVSLSLIHVHFSTPRCLDIRGVTDSTRIHNSDRLATWGLAPQSNLSYIILWHFVWRQAMTESRLNDLFLK